MRQTSPIGRITPGFMRKKPRRGGTYSAKNSRGTLDAARRCAVALHAARARSTAATNSGGTVVARGSGDSDTRTV
ncbi:hypothetical protein GCM10009786_24670 [Leucobacter alluvii]|uniref:Uncharacterized protein n=1 Tax=Leucobacter alluvii TaxID=340321 RepID=A0ABP5N3T0_9MICO